MSECPVGRDRGAADAFGHAAAGEVGTGDLEPIEGGYGSLDGGQAIVVAYLELWEAVIPPVDSTRSRRAGSRDLAYLLGCAPDELIVVEV